MNKGIIGDLSNKVRNEFISEIRRVMITPNLTATAYSDTDESLYRDFIKSVSTNKKEASAELPFDFIIRNELFNLIKDGNVFVTSSVKFKAVVSTSKPATESFSYEFTAKYKDDPFMYTFLDNHPGIVNIDKIKDIPIDYEGLMAVPATILEFKHLIKFNIHRIIYLPIHNGKKIYPRVVISNKSVVTE